MLENVEDQDIKNGTFLALTLLAIVALIVFCSWIFFDTVANDVVSAESAPTTLPELNPERNNDDQVVFQVANATTKKGFASEISKRVKSDIYLDLTPINAPQKLKESTIYYAESKHRPDALQIANDLKIPEQVADQLPEDLELEDADEEADILIILGQDVE